MDSYNKQLGLAGEDLIRRHYEQKGYRCLERNKRIGSLELDLVFRKEQTIVVVEVKTRSNTARGDGTESFDRKKQANLRKATEIYIRRFEKESIETRIDFAIVALGTEPPQIQIIESAID